VQNNRNKKLVLGVTLGGSSRLLDRQKQGGLKQ